MVQTLKEFLDSRGVKYVSIKHSLAYTAQEVAASAHVSGKEMVKATVVKTEGNTALLKAAGWEKERPFTTTAKYACACGESCKCDTISQNPGKCTCGTEMEKVK